MREKIFELARETWNGMPVSIQVMAEDLQIEAEAGSTVHGVFRIRAEGDYPLRGRAYIHGKTLLRLTQQEFAGDEGLVAYEFCAEGLLCGEAQKCELEVYSNCGYTHAECRIQVVPPYVESSIGRLDDLTRFAELCSVEWKEALAIFCSAEFPRVFLRGEERLRTIYEGLRRGEGDAGAMEEFLIAAHLKQKLHLSALKNHINMSAPEEEQEEILVLRRNTWGFGKYRIRTNAAFLKPDRTYIWTDSFVGDEASFGVTIFPEQLHYGKNRGIITIQSITDKLEITMEIVRELPPSEIASKRNRRYQKETVLQLWKGFRGLAAGYFHGDSYVRRQQLIIEKGHLPFSTDLSELLSIHFMGESEDAGVKAEAAERLRRIKLFEKPAMVFGEECRKKLSEQTLSAEEDLVYAVWLFLCVALFQTGEGETPLQDEDSPAVFLQHLKTLAMHRSTCREYWYLYVYAAVLAEDAHNPEQEQSRLYAELLLVLSKSVEGKGHASSIACVLACRLWNCRPDLLSVLDKFSVPAIFTGARYKILSKSLHAQFVYLAGGMVVYHPLVYKTLVGMYQEHASEDVLSAILKHLIRGQQVSTRYLSWFRLGVEKHLRITQLYEYFIYCMGEQDMGALPPSVLIYFQYACALPERKKAALYANIISNKGTDAQSYLNYLPQIERFAHEQVALHKISGNLSVIYADVLNSTNMDAASQAQLIQIMFRQEIRCAGPEIKGVCILYEDLSGEEYVPFTRGRALANVLDSRAVFLFEDRDGGRHYSTGFTSRRLFRLEELREKCIQIDAGNPLLLPGILREAEKGKRLGSAQRQAFERALYRDDVHKKVKERLYIQLLEDAYEGFEEERLRELLKLDIPVGAGLVRRLLEICISAGDGSGGEEIMEKACRLFEENWQQGVLQQISVAKLATLIHWYFQKKPELLLEQTAKTPELKMLSKACYILFLGKALPRDYMAFLMCTVEGTVKELLSVLRSPHAEGDEYQKERCMLAEKILVHALFANMELVTLEKTFTGYYKDRESVKYTERYHIADLVIRAYLFVYASRYLHDEEPECEEVFAIIFRELRHARLIACRYALLKYFSGKKDYTPEQLSWIESNAKECIEEDMVFPFFRDFSEEVRLPAAVRNAAYVSYMADPNSIVTLHYCYETAAGKSEFEKQIMKNRFQGIFVRSFILFYDEKLKYYITEEKNGKELRRTGMMELSEEKEAGGKENSFAQINMMLAALDMQDDVSMRNAMERYIQTSYAQSVLFQPFLR